ncbi:RNA polymerase factor sigma-54 [Peptoniphilus sp. oral taxon 386]|uniref:RNA polymerase factor sigma-54 n=1 Tax=Peptoniphilus sp. oral taxon 386 TaxID=652713 RepID=UPI0002D6F94D|nr:RNA polymerase factor sigma-54 [Peptoniphilus sp. oral taxon 386]
MLKLDLSLIQKLNLTTELIQSIELMELNSIELESFLERESEENVLIDYESKIEDESFRNYLKKLRENKSVKFYRDDEDVKPEDYTKAPVILSDVLIEQLGMINLSKSEYQIGKFLIENIGDDGYLDVDIQEAAKILKTEVHDVFYVLRKIWEFEPKGVGARNLKECLLMQTDAHDTILKNIIEYHLEDIYKNRLPSIAKSQGIGLAELNEYIEKIKKLNPKPGRGYAANKLPTVYLKPEIFVNTDTENIEIEIDEQVSNIQVNKFYLDMLESDIDEETKKYLKQKLTRTLFLIDALEKRRNTIKRVVTEIVKYQRNFFIHGFSLEPMTLSDIANALNISESTVSRATKNKYLECSFGVFPLKYFFTKPLKFSTGKVSRDYIMKKIEDIILNEDSKNPLSDKAITDMLNKTGIEIKRRTVAKYRDELKIAPASNRRRYDE